MAAFLNTTKRRRIEMKPTIEVKPLKAVPVSAVERERAQNELKFFFPARKPYKTAAEPRVGEVWALQRTLPSGLYIDVELPLRFWQSEKKYPDWSKDHRPFQYDVERHQTELPGFRATRQRTFSIAWHPSGPTLATNGSNGPVKLWDTDSGMLLTKVPLRTSGSGLFVGWSQNGELFASENAIHDGTTGDHKHTVEITHLSYKKMYRPFRPNSSEFLALDYGKLELINGYTGEVEKIIDCGLPTSIDDFAWHPSGRFIAVVFKDHHNVRIIDFDEVRTVDSLSAQEIVGWSPNGKTLVLGGELYWDAVEMQEHPITNEMKKELWFQRFSRTINADGLRYIEISAGEGHIYSLGTHEEIASLPNVLVTSAAWSPVDAGLLATSGGSETHIWRLNSTRLD